MNCAEKLLEPTIFFNFQDVLVLTPESVAPHSPLFTHHFCSSLNSSPVSAISKTAIFILRLKIMSNIYTFIFLQQISFPNIGSAFKKYIRPDNTLNKLGNLIVN